MKYFKDSSKANNETNLKDYFFINLISLIMSAVFVCVFFIFRIGLGDKSILLTFKILFIGYFIILFPFSLSALLSFSRKRNIEYFIQYEPFFSLAGLLFIVLFSQVSSFLNLSIIIVVVSSFAFLIYFFIVFIRGRFLTIKDSSTIVIIIVFSLFILFVLWSAKFPAYYFSPIFYQKLFTGEAFIDPIFHGAVANMIKNYGIPSTGLNDTVYLPYHYLSHWVFAQFSKLLDTNALKFYQTGYPVIFVPLFFKLFFLTVKRISYKAKCFMNNKLFWMLILVIFTGLFPKFILERFFVSHFIMISESYNLSIILSLLTFLMIAFFIEKNPDKKVFLFFKNAFFIILLPLLIFLIGLSKSSTMSMFVVVLFYIFVRYGYYKKIVYNISAVFIIISSFLLIKTITRDISETIVFRFFHFFSTVIQGRNEELIWPVTLIIFIIIYFFWSISFITLEMVGLRKSGSGNFLKSFKEKKTIRIEIVLILCIIGMLPGIILEISGGSANYFSELQKWFSIILLSSLFLSNDFTSIDIRKINKKPLKFMAIIIVIILVFSIIYSFITEFKSFYDDYRQTKSDYNLIVNNENKDSLTLYRTGLINVLLELDKLSIYEKNSSLIYIPVDNAEFWDLKIFPKSLSVPLIVPAVSGIAMIYGLPDEGLIYKKTFGYSAYKTTSKAAMDKDVEELFYEIKMKGYHNLIILDYRGGELSAYFINESNIEEYESNVYGLFRRLCYYSFGENIIFSELYNIVADLGNSELSVPEIIAGIILDEESLLKLKNNKEFIESLYLILFDREPDQAGMDYWLSEIEKGKTKEDIIYSFLYSPEFSGIVNIEK